SCSTLTTRFGVGRSGSPMPSEMTSTPALFFSCTLRSISAKRYGGIWPRRLAPGALVALNVVEDSWHRVRLNFEPSDADVAPPPPQLAPRVAAIRRRHHLRELLQRDLAADVGERLGVTDAGEHWRRGRNAGVQRRLRLGDEPSFDLAAAALGQAPVDHRKRRRQPEPDDVPGRCGARSQAAQRRPDRLEHLDGTDDPHRVREVDTWIGIELQEAGAQSVRVERLELAAAGGVRRHAREAEALGQGVDVEHRPALDDRHALTPEDIVDRRTRSLDVLGRVEAAPRIDEIDHVVAHALAVLDRKSTRLNSSHLVDLPRVRDDDLATKSERQVESRLRLADAGRPDDDHDARLVVQ